MLGPQMMLDHGEVRLGIPVDLLGRLRDQLLIDYGDDGIQGLAETNAWIDSRAFAATKGSAAKAATLRYIDDRRTRAVQNATMRRGRPG